MDTNMLFIPDPRGHNECILLRRPIAALQLTQNDSGATKLGLLSQLPAGTTVERCGDGFNDRTTKVRALNAYYFVFLQDLEIQRLN